ncbi:SMC-Scp complex subunit ScpB [bacterium]|nr:SMC-Scp complex subunit ScpB [bacterium]
MKNKNLSTQIESILLISDKALNLKNLAKKLEIKNKELKEIVEELKNKFNNPESGLHLIESWGKIQFTTNPECENIVKHFIKEEINSNLSDASLETLTIIAYRGPITKHEIEQIRGVNCTMIIRNLMIKGLIEKKTDKEKIEEIYGITIDFMKYLGIKNINDLPEYEKLHSNEIINNILNEQQ